MHPTSTASIILCPEPSGPPKGKPIPVIISNGIPPEQLSDTDLDEELQHPDHPIDQDEKEEGQCTDQEDPDDMPPLVSEDDNTYPPDPWNDGAKTLQDNLYLSNLNQTMKNMVYLKEPCREERYYLKYTECTGV